MANGWTDERRKRQAEAIHRWKPWAQSTGPKTDEGKSRSSRNAFKGGWRKEMVELAKVLKQLEKDRRVP